MLMQKFSARWVGPTILTRKSDAGSRQIVTDYLGGHA
jgi:hypothetical protein